MEKVIMFSVPNGLLASDDERIEAMTGFIFAGERLG
jgi:hypothetical protein